MGHHANTGQEGSSSYESSHKNITTDMQGKLRQNEMLSVKILIQKLHLVTVKTVYDIYDFDVPETKTVLLLFSQILIVIHLHTQVLK